MLEVGSGDGTYGRFLATSFPDTRIHGLEPTQALIDRGIDAAGELPVNYTITAARVGDEPIPGAEDGRYGDCLLRYVLQHSSDPVRILRGIYDALPVGGRVFVVEEDSALFVSTEDWPAFATFVDRLERVYAACGSDFQAGRKLHVLAREAGFEVEDFRIGLRTNVDLGTDLLDWLIGMTQMLHHSNPVDPHARRPRLHRRRLRPAPRHGRHHGVLLPAGHDDGDQARRPDARRQAPRAQRDVHEEALLAARSASARSRCSTYPATTLALWLVPVPPRRTRGRTPATARRPAMTARRPDPPRSATVSHPRAAAAR